MCSLARWIRLHLKRVFGAGPKDATKALPSSIPNDAMTADINQYPPLSDPVAFESLCLELWREIWDNSGAQKNGRSGQAQAGVDIFGRYRGRQMGVQCKMKSGLVRPKVSVQELENEVAKALTFRPPLHTFILATTGFADTKVQERARTLTAEHAPLQVEVWSWTEIWHALYHREELRKRLLPIYWPGTPDEQRIFPTRLRHTAETLFGRTKKLKALHTAWDDPNSRVVTIVAWGGVGKTSLLATWAAQMAERGYDGGDYFDWSFYSQGTRDAGGASADAFFVAALEFFGDPEVAQSPASPWDKGARLAHLVAARRALLVLDGLEPLQHPPGPLDGELKDPAVAALLKGLAAQNSGLCVVTTRARVKDLESFRSGTAPEWKLEHLSTAAGMGLLESLGVHGAKARLVQLVEEVEGHALTLNLVGRYLSRAHKGDVRRLDRVQFQRADRTVQGGHAFRAMAAYEAWLGEGGAEGVQQLAVLRLLGMFDRPAAVECLEALRQEPVIVGATEELVGFEEEDWNLTVSALEGLGLVLSGVDGSLDAHPLIREYFGKGLREGNVAGWRAAHGRLFEFLQKSTEHQPDGLQGLQPLYQAVVHGCLAGREQEACVEVYRDRILRGTGDDGFYSTRKLGAIGADLGAVACFFVQPWRRISPALTETDQAWLLNQAAFRLRALGRLTEAIEPMRAALQMDIAQESWKEAAVGASSLSELELTLGDLDGAVREAEQSVVFADRSGDAVQRMGNRTTLADTLHQMDRRDEALTCFREAEEIQAERQPNHPLLHSLPGFRYCDLLLAETERAAWQTGGEAVVADGEKSRQDADAPRGCREVEKRAAQTLPIAERRNWIVIIALDHLTLGRAGLYRAILERLDLSGPKIEIEQAVDGLRRAGDLPRLPWGLLTRAWLRALTNDTNGARADLDEAWEIAERGPMPLFQAEVLLYRARLFRDREALVRARGVIEKVGYERRVRELEDAEVVMEHCEG